MRSWDWATDVEGDDGETEDALTTKGTVEIVRKQYLKEHNLGKLRNDKDLWWWWDEVIPEHNDGIETRVDANALSIAITENRRRRRKRNYCIVSSI